MTGHRAERSFAADHPTAAGHFPGNPIIPGAVVLREIIRAIALAYPGQACRAISAAKFLHPVRPGQGVTIIWSDAGSGEIRFTCNLAEGGVRVAAGALRLGAP